MVSVIVTFVIVFAVVIMVGEWSKVFRNAKRMVAADKLKQACTLPPEEVKRAELFNATVYRNENYWDDAA